MKEDKTTIDRIQLLHPQIREEVALIYKEIVKALKGFAICRFAYTLRTFAEQDALYAQGRTKPGKIVTNAKGSQSYHCYGLAVDIVLLKDKDKNGSFESASWETDVDFDGSDTWQRRLIFTPPSGDVLQDNCRQIRLLLSLVHASFT